MEGEEFIDIVLIDGARVEPFGVFFRQDLNRLCGQDVLVCGGGAVGNRRFSGFFDTLQEYLDEFVCAENDGLACLDACYDFVNGLAYMAMRSLAEGTIELTSNRNVSLKSSI